MIMQQGHQALPFWRPFKRNHPMSRIRPVVCVSFLALWFLSLPAQAQQDQMPPTQVGVVQVQPQPVPMLWSIHT